MGATHIVIRKGEGGIYIYNRVARLMQGSKRMPQSKALKGQIPLLTDQFFLRVVWLGRF